MKDEGKKSLRELRVSEKVAPSRTENQKMKKRKNTKGVLEKFTVEFKGNSKVFSKTEFKHH